MQITTDTQQERPELSSENEAQVSNASDSAAKGSESCKKSCNAKEKNVCALRALVRFFKKKGISLSPKAYFVDAMSSMALGLFATLLMGTILQTLGKYCHIDFLIEAAGYATAALGAVLGISVANRLAAPPLVMYSCAVAGLIGNSLGDTFLFEGMEKTISAGPAGAFLCALIACEVGKIVSKETPVDILVTPLVTILAGFGAAKLLCAPIAFIMFHIGNFVNTATEFYPILMGAVVSVIVGIVLTLPISSAALCAMIGITGVAGGAAAAGCCAQMIGFAVISYRENRVGGLVAQGLGTSMLQMGNIVKNPRIWIAPTLTSAITGALSAKVFMLECTGVNAGMGTCGLVGPIGIFMDMGFTPLSVSGVLIVCIALPAILSFAINELLRRFGWVKDGDMKLEL